MIIGSTERSSTFRDWLSDAIVSILFLKQVNRIVYDKIDKSMEYGHFLRENTDQNNSEYKHFIRNGNHSHHISDMTLVQFL